METLLKGLFDYQRFEENASLRAVIDSVHSRYAVRDLSMEDLDMISAAGQPDLFRNQEKK